MFLFSSQIIVGEIRDKSPYGSRPRPRARTSRRAATAIAAGAIAATRGGEHPCTGFTIISTTYVSTNHTSIYILQRGVQWKQGVVVYIIL